MAGQDTKIKGFGGATQDLGEKAGFIVGGYIDKKGTPSGESAMFNKLPPGMDITSQEVTDQRDMPMKRIISESYPGDGWPGQRDLPE
jgi:hypothetical protein